jgi:predicted nucleotidyltransferase
MGTKRVRKRIQRPSPTEFQAELTRVLDALQEYGAQKIILFGSFARGDYCATSDLDLLIIKQTSRRFLDRIGDVLMLCDYSIPLEPLVYTPEEIDRLLAEGNTFLETVLAEGVVVYESS